MSATISNNIITLSNGTKKIVDYIDIFDESKFGAGNLYLANRVYANKTTDLFGEVKNIISEFFSSADKNIYDANRLYQANKKFLTNDAADLNLNAPMRANNRLEFLIRIHFYGDFGYLHIGIPWEDLNPMPTDDLSDPTLDELEIIKCCWLSDEEANAILTFIKS